MGAPRDACIAKRLWGDLLQGLGVEGSMLNERCVTSTRTLQAVFFQPQQLLLLLPLPATAAAAAAAATATLPTPTQTPTPVAPPYSCCCFCQCLPVWWFWFRA